MRIRRSAGVCAAALAASMSASYAGPCSNDIGSMQAKINHKLAEIVAAGPPAPPSAMVGVAQPTPRYGDRRFDLDQWTTARARRQSDRIAMHFAAVHESAFGTKRTCQHVRSLSAFGGKADI